MAIKGKSKTKSQTEAGGAGPSPRAGRREAAAVPAPLGPGDRGVHPGGPCDVIARVGLTNGVRHRTTPRQADGRGRHQASRPRPRAGRARSRAPSATVGTATQQGASPAMFPDMAAALKAMKKGTVPPAIAARRSRRPPTDATGGGRRRSRSTTSRARSATRGFTAERGDSRSRTPSSGLDHRRSSCISGRPTGRGARRRRPPGRSEAPLVALATDLHDDARTSHSSTPGTPTRRRSSAGGIVDRPIPSGATGTGLGG